jgi:hypothetical protein
MMDDEQLIRQAMGLARGQDWFDDSFLQSLQEGLEKYDSLTDNQRRAVRNIIKMLKAQTEPARPNRKDAVLLTRALELATILDENKGFLNSIGENLKEYGSFTPRQRQALYKNIEKMESRLKKNETVAFYPCPARRAF